ncbi:MAG TPA: tail fiber domain-containing protein [Candidatus Udaeobacter sp.]|nr:tail fiber domain-containing protein [Candidatus Udaeobacter sp.]
MNNRISLAILPVLACFALLPGAQAVTPPPDGCYPNYATAEGCGALNVLTTGIANTALGWYSLFSNTDGSYNTAVGTAALLLNVGDQSTSDGIQNTAVGAIALLLNSTGSLNCAVGAGAMVYNGAGSDNNAFGAFALQNNDSSGNGLANFNNAFGRYALTTNVDGDENDAFGDDALFSVTTGSQNTAMGDDSLDECTTGNGNVAVGKEAGNSIIDGSDNVVLGHNAGIGIVHASRNVAIGVEETGPFADFDDTCFIGSIFGEIVSDPGSQAAVYVDQFNVVGVFNSSRNYKHDIQPMDKASETLYQLKPVTFKFNSDWKGTTQYGLIAEDVAEVDPQLVVRKNGEIVTVRYEQINSMLLNEFLKEHKKVEEQQASISQLKIEMQTMVAQLKEQAAQIQKVSAQLEVSKPASKVVVNQP